MALLPILEFPDPRLHRQKPVSDVNARIRQLIEDMFDTMRGARHWLGGKSG